MRAAQEDAERADNPEAPAPTANGLRALGLSEVSELARAAATLQRELVWAVFKAERNEPWQGRQAPILF